MGDVSLAVPDSPWRGPAFRGQPVGYFQVNPAAVPETPTPTPTRPAIPATPRTATPPSHGPVPSAQPLPAGSTEQRIDVLISRTLAAAGSDTSVVRSDTDHSPAPTTANFAACAAGQTVGVYAALAENVPAPDTNQALYDRIARAWEAAGYSSQDMALGTELFGPAPGADAPEARLSIRGVPDGVTFSIEVVCPAPGS